ncbi:hypothetical protein BC831DRAFT_516074 [Entophlyctis helioformis]|nr:hypothetical protein BC831DRAFT_516074 [Entophlyctis helioformis]
MCRLLAQLTTATARLKTLYADVLSSHASLASIPPSSDIQHLRLLHAAAIDPSAAWTLHLHRFGLPPLYLTVSPQSTVFDLKRSIEREWATARQNDPSAAAVAVKWSRFWKTTGLALSDASGTSPRVVRMLSGSEWDRVDKAGVESGSVLRFVRLRRARKPKVVRQGGGGRFRGGRGRHYQHHHQQQQQQQPWSVSST